MRVRLATAAAAAGLFVSMLCGCSREPEPAHHAEADANWAVTAWGQVYEIFAECEPLVAGSVATSHTHVTVLADFSALSTGTVAAVLRRNDGKTNVFRQPTALRAGIFSIELKPEEPGDYALAWEVESAAGVETIASGRVRVGTSESPGGLVESPHAEQSPEAATAVSFLKEQQWRTPFRTAWAREGAVQRSVRGPARVRPAAGSEAILAASLDGIVGLENRLYVGLEVERGAVLMQLAPRAQSNRTLAELRSEADLARARLVRLEELLKLEAVSAAEVDAARARLAALDAQLEVVRGGAGTKTPVRAPFSGEIAEVHVIPGQAVSAGEALLRILRRTPLWVEVSVLPSDASRLSDALSGLVLEAPGMEPVTLTGSEVRLVSQSPEVDRATGKVNVIIEVKVPVPVKVGTALQGELLLAGDRRGIVIDSSALVDDGGVAVVYVQRDGESFERRMTQVLARQGGLALVDGILAGERIVTAGGGAIRRQSLMSTGPLEGHVH